jgi:hypothetical protein
MPVRLRRGRGFVQRARRLPDRRETRTNAMPRLSTITIDGQPVAPPAQWSSSWVQRRLVEAYSVERRLPASRRRLLIASAWPSMAVEFSDIVGRADQAREDVLQSWEYAKLGVSANDISRMEDAHAWLGILAPYPEERRCLAQWAAAVAYRRSLRRLLLQRRWSGSTFWRRVTAGAYVIALELERRGTPTS